jgi:ADP-ribose pyrophosphatase
LQYHYVILDYLATWLRGELVASDEVEDARWVDPGDLHQYRMTRGTADVIRRLLARSACAAADRQCGEVQDLGG